MIDLTGLNHPSRPTTTKSMGSLRSDGRRIRIKQQRQPLYSFGGVLLKRDPIVESIIESRKFAIMENPYTRLAQTTSQAPRLSQRATPFEIRPSTAEIDHETKDRILSSHSGIKLPSTVNTEIDNEGWDDGTTGEDERGRKSKRNSFQ
jgi:hypothetical protein